MELESWFAKVKQARSHREVFSILDEFRKGEWDDAQRSKMAKLYIRVLENLGAPDSDDLAAASAESAKNTGSGNTPVNDGPVWYEKM